MKNKKTLREKINSFTFNHIWLKYVFDYGKAFLLTVVSALLYAFAFNVFLDPGITGCNTIVAGGVGGMSLVLRLPFELSPFFENKQELLNSIFSLFYIILNIPILIYAKSKGIGKRFMLFTIINVILTSLLTTLLGTSGREFVVTVAEKVAENSGSIGRALFGGVFIGISCAIAFYIESSAGGFDVISYTISVKKGTSTGQYVLLIDATIIIVYNLSYAISGKIEWSEAIVGLLFSVLYIVTLSLLIDLINIRNKKAKVEIITNNEDLPGKLLTHIPHGATVMNGIGVFSGQKRYVVSMIVSTNEVKKVVSFIKELDPESFVSVSSLQQVYGRFHMKPIK